MPDFRLNVTVKQKGQVFNAAASKAAATRMITNINESLAQEGVNRVKERLGHVLQHPTGYYQSRIQVKKGSTYRGVTDGGVIYGGWLEGLSSRNKTTRFKGYHVFRDIQQQLAKDKEKLAQPAVTKFVNEMNS